MPMSTVHALQQGIDIEQSRDLSFNADIVDQIKSCFHIKFSFRFVWDWSPTAGKVELNSTFPAPVGDVGDVCVSPRQSVSICLKSVPDTDYSDHLETRLN